jgi:hypothetical protein
VRRSRSSTGWYVLAGVIVVLGVVGIVFSRSSSVAQEPRANRDHWHAALGVKVCGTWLDNPPPFENDAGNPSARAGIHTHGDGLMHIHPFVNAEAGRNATVGKFLSYGGWSANSDSFEVWDGQPHKTGDKCGDEAATVRWTLNGEERTDNISDYRPKDGDIIALVLEPEGAEIGEPPSKAALANPVDEDVTTVPELPTTPPLETTAPGETTAPTAPGETTAPTVTTPGETTPTSAAAPVETTVPTPTSTP